jgi:Fis1 C-terminal tetratricopeptide repeat
MRETNYAVTALLMDKEPTNLQAQSLSQLIEKKISTGTLVLPHLYVFTDIPAQTVTSEWLLLAAQPHWEPSSSQALYGEQLITVVNAIVC